MKPRIKLADSQTPSGSVVELYQHDTDFSIRVDGEDLMLSRHHESELELARLGCSHVIGREKVNVLIGGLGMGYTLQQTLDMLPADSTVVVSELMSAIIEWNREYLGVLNNYPLLDGRVKLKNIDVLELVSKSKGEFDAILLDVDNGPSAMTDSRNSRLYSYEGIWACRRALRNQGCLSVWSAVASKEFEQLLKDCGFFIWRFWVPAYKGCNSRSRLVWVASERKKNLPPTDREKY